MAGQPGVMQYDRGWQSHQRHLHRSGQSHLRRREQDHVSVGRKQSGATVRLRRDRATHQAARFWELKRGRSTVWAASSLLSMRRTVRRQEKNEEYGYRNGQLLVTAEKKKRPLTSHSPQTAPRPLLLHRSPALPKPQSAINGDRRGLFCLGRMANWSQPANANLPAWLESTSSTVVRQSAEIDVVTIQNNLQRASRTHRHHDVLKSVGSERL